jgi:hypothetical protein
MTEHTIMPAFVFWRRRNIELEEGFILAGRLFMDIPRRAKLKGADRRMIATIVRKLTEKAQSDQMPDDAIVYGWGDGLRPPNADAITSNNEVMAAWARNRLVIEVRVDPRSDGLMRVDSDLARQLGRPVIIKATQ